MIHTLKSVPFVMMVYEPGPVPGSSAKTIKPPVFRACNSSRRPGGEHKPEWTTCGLDHWQVPHMASGDSSHRTAGEWRLSITVTSCSKARRSQITAQTKDEPLTSVFLCFRDQWEMKQDRKRTKQKGLRSLGAIEVLHRWRRLPHPAEP